MSAVKAMHKVSHDTGNKMKFLQSACIYQPQVSANKLSRVPCSHGLIGQTVPGSKENLKISIFPEMLFVEICTVIVLARSDIMRDVQVTAMNVHKAQGQQQTHIVSAYTLKPHVTPKNKTKQTQQQCMAL